MKKDEFDYVAPADLRLGLFVDLDLGWLSHPFASRRFKISSQHQIDELRALGLQRLRYVPAKSDPLPAVTAAPDAAATPAGSKPSPDNAATKSAAAAPLPLQDAAQGPGSPHSPWERQQLSLARCERHFCAAAEQHKQALDLLPGQPLQAAALSSGVVQGLVQQVVSQGESAIRLLTEVAGDKSAMHAVNVTVLALLLGRALQMEPAQLQDLGLAAFLHDVGKSELAPRLRRLDGGFSSAELKAYQSHVEHGVRLGTAMGLGAAAVRALAEHHELADGSGFPQAKAGADLSMGGRILALVNRYDGLCNPQWAGAAMTPHEALALIFSQQKTRFDATVLSAFIRMVGVYPPGSVVQLNDERHALVVSVNSARPLKPRVIVHEPGVPASQALVLDLEQNPQASIRRSLKPASLPAAAQDYLQPRQRISYFFEAVGLAANASELALRA